jgi:predicted esterase
MKFLAILLVLWGYVAVHAEDNTRIAAFQSLWTQGQAAEKRHDDRVAIQYYQQAAEIIPFEPQTTFQLGRCHARLGHADQACASLQLAIDYGWCDTEQWRQTTELESLQTDARFAKLTEAVKACASETVVIYVGKKVDTTKPAPVLVLLQGLGVGPRSEVPYWKPVADQLGLIIVAPRAPHRYSPLLCGWQRKEAKDSKAAAFFDLAAAEQCISTALQQAGQRKQLNMQRIYLAGFSQGGGVALHILGKHPKQYRGAVAVCSLYQPPGVEHWRTVTSIQPVRVAAIAGKLDRLVDRTRVAVKELQEAKVPVQYLEMAQEGHAYPEDYAKRLQVAVEFIMK